MPSHKTESYRSGYNGPHSKCGVPIIRDRGFESLTLRQMRVIRTLMMSRRSYYSFLMIISESGFRDNCITKAKVGQYARLLLCNMNFLIWFFVKCWGMTHQNNSRRKLEILNFCLQAVPPASFRIRHRVIFVF